MNTKKMNEAQVNLILIFVTFLFGINPIVVKIGITEMPPMVFTTMRLFVSVVAFALILIKSGTWIPVEKKDLFVFLKMGIGAFVFQIGMIVALKYVSAAIVATMIGLMPISILLIHTIQGTKKIKSFHYIGTIATFIGVFLVSGFIDGAIMFDRKSGLLGVSILLIAQFAAAVYMVLSEKMLEKYSHYQVSTLMFFVAFILFLIGTMPELVTSGIPKMSTAAIICVIYGGTISLCLANNLWIWGIKKIGSHKAAIFNNLPPVFALVAGILFLNEIPLPSQVLGVVLILVGLYIFEGKLVPSRQEL